MNDLVTRLSGKHHAQPHAMKVAVALRRPGWNGPSADSYHLKVLPVADDAMVW
jgi:hypothetical protein